LERESSRNSQFLSGMYVRVPLDTERIDNEFRDFNIGQIDSINEAANTASIHIHVLLGGEGTTIECSLDHLDRCRVLPDTSFIMTNGEQRGRVLIHCSDEWKAEQSLQYYVQLEGEKVVRRLSEDQLLVASNRHNPDPYQQLLRYEFQNPIWKFNRDRVLEGYGELRNATFGIEELVGARIMLLAHQAEVVARVLADTNCRYILADEVGLGKTIEACVILKGLRRRQPQLRTLIITPASLTQQWHNELDDKFWLNFPVVRFPQHVLTQENSLGCIVSAEDLSKKHELWLALSQYKWGLLIADEAHHLRKSPILYERIRQLSADSERVMILSATPIQRRVKEYLELLALMDPHRYSPKDIEAFKTLVSAQHKISRRTAYLFRLLAERDFDIEEFEQEIESVYNTLGEDQLLSELIAQVNVHANNSALAREAAKEVLSYISENYRIENRVIRNRRAHLDIQLPLRILDTSYSYTPTEMEASTLDTLHSYIDSFLEEIPASHLHAEYCRVLLYAAASSPHALVDVLETRLAQIVSGEDAPQTSLDLSLPAAPRQESLRITQLVETVPALDEEQIRFLDDLLSLAEHWLSETNQVIDEISGRRTIQQEEASHRLVQVLNALHAITMGNASSKIIVFSGWLQTLEALLPRIEQRYGRATVTRFTCDLDEDQLQENADTFQGEGRCRILLCDELGGEGRNFQVADHIIHVDLPWTPVQIEQRIGRVDRLGRREAVRSLVPFSRTSFEQDLFQIWQKAFRLFTQSMSGLEIALESIQNDLLKAIASDSRAGLADLTDAMVERAGKLRKDVEEERYYEEASINYRQRAEFATIADKYRDGKVLSSSILKWASLAGLHPSDYDPHTDILSFNPKGFNIASMRKAKFLNLPNMEEALHRSGRRNNLLVRGTFNRDIAVLQENIIFFAPGSDRWVDAIIANAMEADRGRCCAILRKVPELKGVWRGFELLYSYAVDPRYLYAVGYDPVHLFRALGFLRVPTMRLLISTEGQRERSNSIIWQATKKEYINKKDVHLGRRDGPAEQIHAFKENYPADSWQALLASLFSTVDDILEDEFDATMADMAEEARNEFEQHAAGLRAAHIWQQRYSSASDTKHLLSLKEIEEYELVSVALIKGIRRPMKQLESVCYWILEGDRR
jgi:ATP-dependent helicase HepA